MDQQTAEIEFTHYNPPFVRSTKKQRELLERLAKGKRLSYQGLVSRCGEVVGRGVRDIGELSLGEADRVIREIQGRQG